MRFGSLFSGIEAASVAWQPLGWECAWVAEIEPFPCAVLAHHYPGVPNIGNVKEVTEERIRQLGPVDLVVFGFPCQDLSVAGKRAGLKGERSGLFFDAMRIVRWSRARWAVAENVPGLFSTHGGRDFAAVVGEMAGADFDVPRNGWESSGAALGAEGMVEWGVLDAQFFGLAQRRKRVFLVRDIGDWASRPPILLESESLRGDPAPRREAREGVANSLTERPDRGGGNSEGQRLIAGTLKSCAKSGTPNGAEEADRLVIAPALTSNYGKQPDSSDTSRGPMLIPDTSFCLTRGGAAEDRRGERDADPHPVWLR